MCVSRTQAIPVPSNSVRDRRTSTALGETRGIRHENILNLAHLAPIGAAADFDSTFTNAYPGRTATST